KEDKEESEDSPADWENVTGNGPYRIISHEPGKETVLEKNPFYKNPDRPGEPFEKVIWKYEGDSNREYSDLLNGEIDAIAEIPAEIETGTQAFFTAETAGSEKTGSGKPTVSAAETAGSEGTVTETGMRAYFAGTAEENAESDSAPVYQTQIVPDLLGILFNCNNEALGDMRVRRALSLAVDRAYLVSVILDGMYAPAEDFTGILTGSAAAKTEDAESTKDASDGSGETERTGSFAEAKKLLEEAGYAASHGAGEEFPVLTCIADENGAAFLAAEYLASAWNELGIEVRVKTADPDEIAQEKKAGTFDMICGNVFLSSDLPAAELGRFVSESAENASGFSSGEYDLLLETAFQETDADRYDEELQGAARLLAVESPSAPLAVRSVSWISRRDSTGIFCDPTGCWQLWKQPEPAAGETAEEESLTAGAGGGTGGGMPETRSGQSSFSTEGGNSIKDGDSIKDEKNAFSGFFMNTAADTAETQGESFFSLAKKSDFYFERADTDAWLTQQAWVLDDVGSKGNRVVSLPKYTTVHLNGMGNDRYVRMVIEGKFHYLTADSVTTDPAALEAIRETEQERILQREIIAAPIHQAKEIELSARAQEIREETERILAEIAFQEALRTQTRNPNWDGPVLSRSKGSVYGPSGKETYYNLNMSGVVNIMRRMGNTDEYWVRDDGCKMLGNYIMCAANLRVHPRGSLVECSLGTCIVCDTGGFASHNANQLDIAVTW
ncbi:MAG: ABC transporter substrate-binding protein, partial [Eubacteriales bacterium]|nr:ABC transporter substrate-binding protein [Eubacteriales bacterium]